jgi:hypothetical protein
MRDETPEWEEEQCNTEGCDRTGFPNKDFSGGFVAGEYYCGSCYEDARLSHRLDELQLKKDLHDHAVSEENFEGVEYRTREKLLRKILQPEWMEGTSTGGYSGTLGFVIEEDDKVWIIKEAYGSCEYCDGLLAAESAYTYTMSMLKNAYCFGDYTDAYEAIKLMNGFYWQQIKNDLLNIIEARYD